MKQQITMVLALLAMIGVASASEEDGLYDLTATQQSTVVQDGATVDQKDVTVDTSARTASVDESVSRIMDQSPAVVPGANWPEGT